MLLLDINEENCDNDICDRDLLISEFTDPGLHERSQECYKTCLELHGGYKSTGNVLICICFATITKDRRSTHS